MPDITVKRHDTFPGLTILVEQENEPAKTWEPIPNIRTATSITLILKSQDGKTLIEGLCTVLSESVANPATGNQATELGYVWAGGDTAVAGTYNAEIEINWGGGKIQSIPNEGYRQVVIAEDLPNA